MGWPTSAGLLAVAKMQRPSPPREGEGRLTAHAEFVICDHTIEVYHKVLKSGCAIERRQLRDVDHLQRCLALFGVIAWRVLYATMLARTLPDAPCTALLEEGEWQALYCHIHQTTQLPPVPPPLAQAVRWIARLGGYHGRAHDGPPGVTARWRGFHSAWATSPPCIMSFVLHAVG